MVRTVLVVDDDAGFRDLATRVLTSWGHHVIGEAGSVAEGLARAIELRPDAVLADIGLPDGDGFELAHRICKLPGGPFVVLISSDADATNGPAARRAGARGFWPKEDLTGRALRDLIADG